MASAIKIEVTRDVGGAIGAAFGLNDGSFANAIRLGIGEEEAQLLRTHFEKLENERSGQIPGATPTHFWTQVRDSVRDARVDGDDVVIGIDHVGFRQRLEGGTITAGRGTSSVTGEPTKFLAIPVDVDSYGKRPADFPEGALQYIVGPGGPCLILAEHTDRIATKGKNKGKSVRATGTQEATVGAGSVMFILRASVTQKADPSVLPTEQEIIAAAYKGGDAVAELYLSRAGGDN